VVMGLTSTLEYLHRWLASVAVKEEEGVEESWEGCGKLVEGNLQSRWHDDLRSDSRIEPVGWSPKMSGHVATLVETALARVDINHGLH